MVNTKETYDYLAHDPDAPMSGARPMEDLPEGSVIITRVEAVEALLPNWAMVTAWLSEDTSGHSPDLAHTLGLIEKLKLDMYAYAEEEAPTPGDQD